MNSPTKTLGRVTVKENVVAMLRITSTISTRNEAECNSKE